MLDNEKRNLEIPNIIQLIILITIQL